MYTPHETYTWGQGRRWHWRCLTCGAASRVPYRRRRDADDAASAHDDDMRTQETKDPR